MFCAVAAASAAGIDSCEKIKDADAYNACLASYGPAVGEHRFTAAPPAESGEREQASGAKAAAHGARRGGRQTAETARQGPKRQANGRVRIEIFPGK